MWEPKISKLKGGYSSSAGLVFQSWLKDIHVHVEDRKLTQIEAIHLVKDFTTEHDQDEVEFYMGIIAQDQSLRPHRPYLCCLSIWQDIEWADQQFSWPVSEGQRDFADDLQVLARKS